MSDSDAIKTSTLHTMADENGGVVPTAVNEAFRIVAEDAVP